MSNGETKALLKWLDAAGRDSFALQAWVISTRCQEAAATIRNLQARLAKLAKVAIKEVEESGSISAMVCHD